MTKPIEPVAWEAPAGLGIARFISDRRYRLFSPGVQRHYKPYKCASCTDHAAAIEAAKQEGRRQGLEEAAKVCDAQFHSQTKVLGTNAGVAAGECAGAIRALINKAKP